MLGSGQRQLVVHRLNLPISWCATVSSMTLMVKLESWGYSHKSRIAWASCFWLTRTPVICVFHFHAPPFTWWEYVTMKCNYVKTSNQELMFIPFSVSQILMQVWRELCQCDIVQCWCLWGTTQRLCLLNVNFFRNDDLVTGPFKIRKHCNIYLIHVYIFNTCIYI